MAARMVFLNGPPSVGKSTVARALQEKLDTPFFRLDLDEFQKGYSQRWRPGTHGPELFSRTVDAWLLALQALGRTGNDVIAPTMITSALGNVARHVELFREFTVYLIGLRCPVEVAQERENSREDRTSPLDLNGSLYRPMHLEFGYDLDIDTSTATTEDSVQRIYELLKEVTCPTAFSRLARVQGIPPRSGMPPKLRSASLDDAAALARFHQEVIFGTYSDDYPPGVLHQWAGGHTPEWWRANLSGTNLFVLAEQAGTIIGCGGLANDRTGVYILPRAQRQGVGRAIFAELEKLAYQRDISTLHLSAPLRAIPFYESMGFQRVGSKTKRFHGREEMTVYDMQKSITR